MVPLERDSHHHQGGGHGPVEDAESVALGVFAYMCATDGQLTTAAFPSELLKKRNLSVARAAYIDGNSFVEKIVEPQRSLKGECRHVALALVQHVREVPFSFHDVLGRISVEPQQAICVLASVTAEDHDSHAVLGYSDEFMGLQNRLVEANIGQAKAGGFVSTARATVAKDLVEVFNRRISIEELPTE